MILKNYANLAYGQTHYRRSAQSPESRVPLVLLHASPMSSELMLPMMQAFANDRDVIAPDTPGYGNSDPLPDSVLRETDDLSPYVEWLLQLADSLELDEIILYGSATGAQIGIEFAKAHPQRVSQLILENAAHFEEAEREEIVAKYFPSIAPLSDGSHLEATWDMVTAVFKWFPWFSQDEAHRISDHEPPAEFVHAAMMAYFKAGNNYSEAYRRAFQNESIDQVQPITVPVAVIRWSDSILKKYVDRFDDFPLPENIKMEYCGAGMKERFAAIERVLNTVS